jgi:hypothetical protein
MRYSYAYSIQVWLTYFNRISAVNFLSAVGCTLEACSHYIHFIGQKIKKNLFGFQNVISLKRAVWMIVTSIVTALQNKEWRIQLCDDPVMGFTTIRVCLERIIHFFFYLYENYIFSKTCTKWTHEGEVVSAYPSVCSIWNGLSFF